MAAAPEIEAFTESCLTLIRQATEYAAAGVYNPDTDVNIRQVRVVTTALLSALGAANIPRPPG